MRSDYALSAEDRADARAAKKILAGTGISLEEAARRAIQGRKAVARVTVSDAADYFFASRIKEGKRARTIEWYEARLQPLVSSFGEKYIDDVQRSEIFDWAKKLPGSAASRAGICRAARALFSWGMRQEPQLVAIDPTVGLQTTGPSNDGDAEFLKPAEVRKIMDNAGPYQSALALMFFAGIRSEEIAGKGKERMLWKHVRVSEKLIRIPAELAKTGKARVIEGLPETVWAWLKPGKDEEPIAPGRSRQAVERASMFLSRPWPKNAARHSFGTFALALTSDAGKVSTWLGHEGKPSMLHRHYRGLAVKADAEAYFGLLPRSGS